MWILDTDHLSVLEYGESPTAVRLKDKLQALNPLDYGTTIINYEEQCWGWLGFIKQKKTVRDEVNGYRKLHKQLRHYCNLVLLDFDEHAAVEFQRLRGAKVRISASDLKIASIALSIDAVLLTRNDRDFVKVPGLRFEDWTK